MNEISELVILLNDQNILCVDNKNNDEHSINSHTQSSRNLEWYRQALEEGRIVKFEYSGFNNLREIGRGGYGVVYLADYGDQKVALKQFTQNSIENFANEIKQIYTVNNHENINRFHGITKDPNTNDFIMVLQFAKDGNLRDYLERQWNNDIFKISLTKIIHILEQIVQGLNHLHSNNIIHRDLHSRNILINGERILIADFGLARELNCISSSSNIIGVPAYFDAMCLLQRLKPDKKSDIYSLGVIMWELTSGKPPFNKESLAEIIFKIVHGDREVAIPSTPEDYVALYQKCWSAEPNQRPSLNEILGCLGEISKQADNKFITYNYRQISQRRPSTPSLIRDDSLSSNSSSDHSEYFSFYQTLSKQISIDTTNIITRSHAEKIANWIYGDYFRCEFRLLYMGSRDRDGPEFKNFHKNCDNSSRTVVVLKVRGTNEILGGYNPIMWKTAPRKFGMIPTSNYGETDKGFIFSFKGEKTIHSKVKNGNKAIYYKDEFGFSFGKHDLSLINDMTLSYKFNCRQKNYNKLIRSSTGSFDADDYQVFEVIDR